jgi:flagellar protein FlaI
MSLVNLVERMRRVKHPERYEQDEETPEPETNVDGVSVPKPTSMRVSEVDESEESQNNTDVDVTYPLVPADPDPGETVYAWAHISFDEEEGELKYRVVEPRLDSSTEQMLSQIRDILQRNFDIDFTDLETEEAEDYLEEQIDTIVDKYNISMTQEQREKIRYYARRDFAGLGKLQPLMNDTEIEDISCDGTGIPVYAYHRNPEFGSVATSVSWDDPERLDSFVMKLAQRCGQSISVSQPLLDGSLPDGSRVQATLSTDIARHGSNFTIRRFTEDPLTPVHMMDYETEDPRMMSYLWTLVENEKSVLVCGTTGAGKTSQLNALSLFIKPEKKIVSIEDTPELRIPHEHWVPEVARSGFGSSVESGGEVSMDDLLKESLRQRPEYILVGEVRGEEAYILFQQMATGHTGMSTIHADSLDMLMDRLTTNPINLSGSLIETLDLIMIIKRIRRGNKYIRRVTGLYEVDGYNERTGIDANQVFDWNPQTDEYHVKNDSIILKEIVQQSGRDEEEMRRELVNKQHILQWMQDQQIKDYREVGDILARYYSDPASLMERVENPDSSGDQVGVKS